MGPDPLLLIALQPDVVELLRLVGTFLHEPDRRRDEDGELQELGLPVLQHRAAEVGRDHVLPPRERLLPVLCVLRAVVVLAGKRLADERREEDRGEEERESPFFLTKPFIAG